MHKIIEKILHQHCTGSIDEKGSYYIPSRNYERLVNDILKVITEAVEKGIEERISEGGLLSSIGVAEIKGGRKAVEIINSFAQDNGEHGNVGGEYGNKDKD